MKKFSLPAIELGDITLREVTIKDYQDMFIYGSDLGVVAFLSWGPFKRLREAKYAIKRNFLTRPKRGLPVGYAIVDNQNDKMIGTIDYHTKHDHNTVEIGYALNKDYWNRGIVTKALKAVLAVGFNNMQYDAILIKHARSNIASKRVIEKNGFRLYEVRSKEYYNRVFKDFEDVLVYKMTATEYFDKEEKSNVYKS